jgi:hypothetical protein
MAGRQRFRVIRNLNQRFHRITGGKIGAERMGVSAASRFADHASCIEMET